MKLTKELCKEIFKEMFWEWSFQDVEFDEIEEESFKFRISPENNWIKILLEESDEEEYGIKVFCHTRSESYEKIGEYSIEDSDFECEPIFFKIMFNEHLK